MSIESWPRTIIVAAFLVAVVAGVYTALLIYDPIIKPILEVAPPFIIAFIIAYLLDPIIDRFEKWGVSRGLAVGIVGLSFLIIFVLVGFLLVPRVVDQATQLAKNYPDYVKQVNRQANGFLRDNEHLLKKFQLPTTASEWTRRFSSQIQTAGRKGFALLADSLSAGLSRALWLILIPLTTLYLLKDFNYISSRAANFVPDRHKQRVVRLCGEVGGVFANYVRGMITVAIIFSVVTMIVFTAAGLNYGLIIGAIAGIFYLVPYIGLLIIGTITFIAAMVQPHSMIYPFLLVGFLLVQNTVFDMVVTPKVVGGKVGVHPILSLFALALGARMFGVVGMVAAVPVAASLQVAIAQLYPGLSKIVEQVPEETESLETADETVDEVNK